MYTLTTWLTTVFIGFLLITGASAAGPVPAGLGLTGPPCPAGTGSTVRLSEALGGACTAAALQAAIFTAGQGGTVLVDTFCELDAGLRLPSRFTLKGDGLGSNSILHFTHDGIGLSMCQESPRGYVTIQDLDLYGPCLFDPDHPDAACALPHATGIAIANQNIVKIAGVRVSNFQTGIVGSQSYSVFIYGSNVSDNRGDNISIGNVANGWRIRDGLVSQAGRYGINAFGHNDLLIDGVRLESNRHGAIRVAAEATRIINNRFEFNGQDAGFRAIVVEPQAVDTRILTNYFSGNCIEIAPGNASTARAFNMPASHDNALCRP